MTLHTPPACAGQIVEVSYGWHEGTLYRRDLDRSDMSETWLRAHPRDPGIAAAEPWNAEPTISHWIPCACPSTKG